jgi:uncharacterized protein with HEPN domain
MSTQRDPKVYLWDAREAATAVLRFARGKNFDDLIEDELLRSGVERQMQIVGEALSQLAKTDPEIAGKIPYLRQIIAFRNILVHAYASIDYENVWRVIHGDLPDLILTLSALLGTEDLPTP